MVSTTGATHGASSSAGIAATMSGRAWRASPSDRWLKGASSPGILTDVSLGSSTVRSNSGSYRPTMYSTSSSTYGGAQSAIAVGFHVRRDRYSSSIRGLSPYQPQPAFTTVAEGMAQVFISAPFYVFGPAGLGVNRG